MTWLWFVLKIVLVVGLIETLACGLWWWWRRSSPLEPPKTIHTPTGLPWHYDPSRGQYVPDDHWPQPRPPHV